MPHLGQASCAWVAVGVYVPAGGLKGEKFDTVCKDF